MSISVTTITELVNALNTDEMRTNGGEIIVKPKKDNTLDFNNEEYYYKRSSFLTLFNNDVNPNTNLNRNITIDFNNANLTNIFLYPNVSFLYLKDIYVGNSSRNNKSTCIIKNGNFEIVSNDGYFTYYKSNTNNSSIYDSTIQFINCVFNIKITNSNHEVFHLAAGQVDFINCVFNIEYININKHAISFLYICTPLCNILSSEFRFRFRTNTNTDTNTNFFDIIYIQDITGSDTYILDNVFFLNRLFNSDENSYYRICHMGTTKAPNLINYTNNFVGSFDKDNFGGNGKIIITDNFRNASSFVAVLFYDSDKIDVIKTTSNYPSTKIGLPTADCKNAEKLTEAGYVFASES